MTHVPRPRHWQLIFKIRNRAQPPDRYMHTFALCIIDQQAAEEIHLYIRQIFCRFF